MRPTVAELETRLLARFPGDALTVVDDSHRHAGHEGARGGAGHFTVHLVSARFDGLGRLARHRLVYDAVADWVPNRIHALSIVARSPSDPPASAA
jgi:BolA protein